METIGDFSMKRFIQTVFSIFLCFFLVFCAASNSVKNNVEDIEIERYGADLDCSLEVVDSNELVFNLRFKNDLNKTIAVPWFYLYVIDWDNDLVNGEIYVEDEKEKKVDWHGKMASINVEGFKLESCKIFKPNDEFVLENIKLKEHFYLEDLDYEYLRIWYYGAVGLSNTICIYRDSTFVDEGKMSLDEAFEKQFR